MVILKAKKSCISTRWKIKYFPYWKKCLTQNTGSSPRLDFCFQMGICKFHIYKNCTLQT